MDTSKPASAYDIPKDCIAIIENGKVRVYKRVKPDVKVNRCKDCKYQIYGNAFINETTKKNKVCQLRPKMIKDKRYRNQELYYVAYDMGIACDKFKKKD